MSYTIDYTFKETTSGTVNLNDTKSDSVTYLPSAKEYKEAANKAAFQFTAQWSEPKYQCPKCDGGMCKNMMVVLTTYPAKYEYQCDKCGHIDYQYI